MTVEEAAIWPFSNFAGHPITTLFVRLERGQRRDDPRVRASFLEAMVRLVSAPATVRIGQPRLECQTLETL